MPRTTSISNGRLYLAHDKHWNVRELCWPLVGHPNHLVGHKVRLGLWCAGVFAWSESDACQPQAASQDSQFAAHASFLFPWMGLELEVWDTVLEGADVWIRRVVLRDLLGEGRLVRVFQSHDLRLRETDISDTAFFHPGLRGVVHYKDDVATGFSIVQGDLCGYACGMKGYGGFEGTWRDAEDGQLSGKPIEQGTVDSTLGVEVSVPAHGVAEIVLANHWAHSIHELEASGRVAVTVPRDAPTRLTLKEVSLDVVKSFFARSSHGAALVAATDSDIMTSNRANYGSVWLRDHALNCMTLLKYGENNLVSEGIDFGFHALHPSNLPVDHPPVFAQKYLPNGRIGPSWHPWLNEDGPMLPWQEDETTLFVSLYCEAYFAGIEGKWREQTTTVFSVCDFLASQVAEDGLPTPSWDLWEERHGVHCWTTATTIEALQWAAELAETVGDPRSATYARVAEAMTVAFKKVFFGGSDPVRTFQRKGREFLLDPTPDMSVLAALLRRPFRGSTDLLVKTLRHCGRTLFVESSIGGFGRYVGDYYFRVREGYVGNPWVITTLWLAQAERASGYGDGARWMDWVADRASATLMLSEQFNPDTGEPLSVMPLAWSHGEYLETLVRH